MAPPVKVPLPPRNAQTFSTVCQFCIVGCGYKVYKWPVGRDGVAEANALGVDFRQPQAAFGKWVAPSMHAVITERDGKQFNIAIVPDDACSVNSGLSSVRGGGLAATLYAPDRPTKARLTTPLLAQGDGQKAVSWDEAVGLGAAIIKAVTDRWGADAVGMKFFDHGGGGGGFENNWAVGRLFFSGIGTRSASIHNRPAYNSEVHAAGDAGIAALTNAYVDAQLADTILVVGANPYETQTNYFLNHMVKNLSGDALSLKRGAFGAEAVEKGRMIVVDPRRTMTVAAAEAAAGKERVLHLAIEPGSDIWLLNGIARIILERNWHDGAFISQRTETQTFEAYQRSSLMMDRPRNEMLGEAAQRTGISIADMEKAAQWIAAPKADGSPRRCLMHYEKGLIWGFKNYENVAAIVDLALLTGSLGKPGSGVSRLGGHQEGYVRPPYPGGRPALNVDEAVRRGAVKLYWVGGCNPLLTTLRAGAMEVAFKERGGLVTASLRASQGKPIGERVAGVVEALKQGGMFLMVQDIYSTASSAYAHLVLPAAGWGETNLTSINGERRLRLYQRFMDPPGDAKPDWAIMALFAKKLHEFYRAEGNSLLANRFLDFDWASDEDVFIQARYAFKGTAADPIEGYAGVTYDLLRRLGPNGIQTPTRIVNNVVVGTARLYEDGKFATPSGKARFITASPPYPGYAAKVEAQRKRYRFWINNGRSNHIWQTVYHHRFLDFFNERMPIPHLEMHPDDAKELQIAAGDVVEIANDVGRVEAMAYPTDAVKRGHTFLIFGQPRGAAGELVSDHVDPATTIPYYKGAWADVRRIGPRPELTKTVSFLPQNVAE
ncbi:MAG: arsenate reductase (azurin) large subunit [Hyphomonadaceae bacterium]|nr:arsenate reductase (azurin) large subunit [Hyphomonadaceae bacterium]